MIPLTRGVEMIFLGANTYILFVELSTLVVFWGNNFIDLASMGDLLDKYIWPYLYLLCLYK
jgi:hypothetical protein